jgi:hypothetical protein
MEIHDGVRLPAVQREIYESAIKHLNELVNEARRSRHSPCEHRIVQTDEVRMRPALRLSGMSGRHSVRLVASI